MTTKHVTYIVVGGLACYGLIVAIAFWVGPVAGPTVTPLGNKGPARPLGRPGQGLASTNALHVAHGSASVVCAECHEDEGRTRVGHRCVRCHEQYRTRIHAALADDTATECAACHDFLHLPAAARLPWDCARCHVDAEPAEAPARIKGAPIVTLHAAEFCGSCHAPHGAAALGTSPCTKCHEAQTTSHGAGAPDGGNPCLSCHSAHRPVDAKQKCLGCHEAKVSASALFDGHDRCVVCHPPHGFTRATAATCGDCHRDKVGKSAAARRRHADCVDCHNPHVGRAPPAGCARCHARQSSTHKASKRGACAGCHPVHESAGAAVVGIVACTSCHDEARSDKAFHSGAKCAGCHHPHGKLVDKPTTALCLRCHSKRVGDAVAIEPSKGHSTCRKCHGRAEHDNSRKPYECPICHKPLASAAKKKGLSDCRRCHVTHSGALRSGISPTNPH